MKIKIKALDKYLEIYKNLKILKWVDDVEEKLGKTQNKLITYNKRSMRFQRLYSYSTSLFYYFCGIIGLYSWNHFSTRKQWSQVFYPDVYLEMLLVSSNIDQKLVYSIDNLLEKGMEAKELDGLSYATLGRLYSQINQADLAQTAYYMAHLKEYNKFGANSDLELDTTRIPAEKAIEDNQ